MMFRSIRTRVLTFQLALTLSAMLCVGSGGYFVISRYLNSGQKEWLQDHAVFAAERIDDYFIQNKTLMERLSTSREFQDYKRTFKELLLLKSFFDLNKTFPLLAYINIKGLEEVKVIGNGVSEHDYRDYSKDPFYQESLQKSNSVIITSVAPSAELGEPVVRLMLSRYAYFGAELLGTLEAAIPVSAIGILFERAVGKTGALCIVDKDGRIVYHPQKGRILTRLSGEGKEAAQVIGDCSRLQAGFIRAQLLGMDSFVAYVPMKEVEWSVLVMLPAEEFLAAGRHFKTTGTGIFLFIVSLTVLLSLLATRHITRSLTQLVAAVHAIARGQFSDRVKVTSQDEVGALGAAFNNMTENLHRTMVSRDEMMKMKIAAEEANRAKSRFLSNVSHEIRTPLHAILAFSESIAQTSSMDEIHRHARVVANQSGLLVSLIDDLLDQARIEAGNFELVLGPCDLVRVVEDTRDLMASIVINKDLAVKVHIEPTTPRYLICDDRRIRQVLINLVGNAIKFTPRGCVTIDVRLADETPREGFALIFRVIDTGIGIPADKMGFVFDPFFQVDNRSSGNFSGSGLGTTISKKLVELMGGHIGCESELGKGSTFWFVIPLKHCTPGQIESLMKSQDHASPAVDSAADFASAKILIADDSEVNLEVMRGVLSKLGITDVTLAMSGAQALEACRACKFDCVFMDVQMRDMDGTQAAQMIRKLDPERASVPIIAVTALADQSIREGCMQAGMNDVQVKPFRAPEIAVLLKKHLR